MTIDEKEVARIAEGLSATMRWTMTHGSGYGIVRITTIPTLRALRRRGLVMDDGRMHTDTGRAVAAVLAAKAGAK